MRRSRTSREGLIAVAPKPGWYPDPEDLDGSLRWWDGQDWAEATAPSTADVASLPGAVAVEVDFWSRLYSARADESARGNAAATMSVVMGVASVITGQIPHFTAVLLSVFTAISAVVWGLIGVRRAVKTGVGLARALSGTVLGVLVCVLSAIGVAYLVGAYS